MPLTIQTCADMIRQSGDWELAPGLDVPMLAKEAGDWLYAQAWSWNRRTGTLGTTAAASFASLVALSAIKVDAVQYTGPNGDWLQPTDIDDLVERRVSGLSSGSPGYWAQDWRTDANGVPYRTLEFDTTFVTTNATGLTLVYYAGWPGVVSYVPVPPEYEGLYIHALRAVARGYMDEDMGSVAARLQAIKTSDMFMSLRAQDSEIQPRRGMMRGGGVNGQLYRLPDPNYQRIHL